MIKLTKNEARKCAKIIMAQSFFDNAPNGRTSTENEKRVNEEIQILAINQLYKLKACDTALASVPEIIEYVINKRTTKGKE